MGYSRNLAFHGQWGLIPGETANSAISPLNVALLVWATARSREAIQATDAPADLQGL